MNKSGTILLLLFFWSIFISYGVANDIERTKNVTLSKSRDIFLEHVEFVKVHDPINVKIKTDGKILAEDGKKEFLLHVGKFCNTTPARHTSIVYKMLRISKGNVIFEYTSKFDHRSFGKNKISIDQGKFRIPFYKR